jgi:uncharacterized protein YaaN involved in tellurite resistance
METDARQLPVLMNLLTEDKRVNIEKFSDADQRRIVDIARSALVLDSATVTAFGAEPQQRMNAFLDELLQGIRTDETGMAGELTIELATSIKAMNLSKMKSEAEGGDWVARSFGKLPIIGKYASAIRYFQLSHKRITSHLADIESKAQREVAKLAATNSKLDRMVEASLVNLKELELHLAAGQQALLHSQGEFAKKRDILAQNPDAIELAKLRDMAEQINAFEARLLRMHIAFTDSLISIPQIRANQEAGRIESRNIIDTIIFDLPRLKGAILRVAALKQIVDASKANEARRKLAREIGSIGADALDEAYTRAKTSQGSGAEDVAALAATADKLLETIAKGVRIDEENRQKRDLAQRQLGDIKTKLMSGLKANADQLLKNGIGNTQASIDAPSQPQRIA